MYKLIKYLNVSWINIKVIIITKMWNKISKIWYYIERRSYEIIIRIIEEVIPIVFSYIVYLCLK